MPILLAFGANLGDRGETILAAQNELEQTTSISGFTRSPLRETVALTPSGPDPDAPRYINAVALAQTTLDPHDLLDLLQRIEHKHGRQRSTRWADRTLDIDLILYGGRVIKDERLTVPHPRAHERDFVLAPWLDLDANAVLMGHGRVADLLARIGDTTRPVHAAGEPLRATAAGEHEHEQPQEHPQALKQPRRHEDDQPSPHKHEGTAT